MKKNKIRYCVKERNITYAKGVNSMMYSPSLVREASVDELAFADEYRTESGTNASFLAVQHRFRLMGQLVLRHLMKGHSVEIPSLGTLELVAHTKVSPSPEGATPDKIERLHVRFVPCMEIRKQIELDQIEFTPIDSPLSRKLKIET